MAWLQVRPHVAPRAAFVTAVVLALQAMLACGFGPSTWMVPRKCDTESLRRGGSWPEWGSRELAQQGRPSPDHIANVAAGKRKRRVRMMSAVEAGAAGMNNDAGMLGGGRAAASGSGGKQKDPAAGAMDVVASEADEVDYYAVLGLKVGASPTEIKNAYRKIAMLVHPDTKDGINNRDIFESATAAYEVLSDPGKKSTYDQGLAMRSFVDKVKAGKWGNVMSAVASLGAAATSVGVSAGVAAAEPLAKDLARGLEELTGSVEVDPITRKQQVANRAKLEAQRKRDAFERRAEEFSNEASQLEETMKTRLEEQKEWNKALVERRSEVASARKSLESTESITKEAAEVASDRKASELAAAEKARRSRAAREEFLQASANSEKKVSTAEATVTAAERRLWEALKTLDTARHMLALTYEEATALEGTRDQASFDALIATPAHPSGSRKHKNIILFVMADTASAEGVFAQEKEATLESKAALSQQRTDLAALQREFRERSRREEQAMAKIKELGDAAESIGARALRTRKSAEESKVAARREAGAIDAAARQESRLAAEAVAAKAKLEAAAAAAQEEKAKRDRAEAARAAAEAVERARLAEQAAGAAAEAAIKAATAARQATAEAVAAAEKSEDPEKIGEMAPEHMAFESISSSAVDAAGDAEHAPEDPTAGEPGVETLTSPGTAAVPEPR
ncbi:unnamed protein product [Ectocarpus sp. 12 AP-2014]